jgi:hypothetical protein
MNARKAAFEFVDVVKVYRNGREQRESMPRWLAELFIGCIPSDEPDVARARIAPIEVDAQARYPARRVSPAQTHYMALQLAVYLPAVLAA